jgi:ABC-type nitrate/sulfonate/bicarbonate transport system permease component
MNDALRSFLPTAFPLMLAGLYLGVGIGMGAFIAAEILRRRHA